MFRCTIQLIRAAAAVAALGLVAPRAEAAEAEVVIMPVEAWGCVFGGRKVELHFAVEAKQAVEGRAAWGLAVQRATVARGEAAVTAGPQKPGEVTIRLDLPEAREGIVLPAVLSLAIEPAGGGGPPLATLTKQLFIFPDNPFALRTRWLEQLDIQLFDPQHKTQQVLEKMKIPFRQTANVDSLAGLEKGLLIVGEGTSLAEYRGLAKAMVTAASRGVPVICLAPSGGEMALPGSEGADLPLPLSIALRRNDVIADFDKRFDVLGWSGSSGKGDTVASRLLLKGDRSGVTAAVNIPSSPGGEAGWPWIEIGFPAQRGKLVICGFAVVQKWDDGPVPRYLLLRLMERLAGAEVAGPAEATKE